jgi:hypothetical protein
MMPMGKGRLERFERLRDLCKRIVDDPHSIDGDTKAKLKTATIKYASTLHDDPTQALEVLYHDQDGLGALVRKAVEVIADHDTSDDPIRAPVSDHHASKVADLLVETGRYPHRAAALDHLLHDKRGQALLTRMHKKDEPMDILKELVSIMKDCGGLHAFAKSVCDRGRAPCSEAEFTAAVTEFAKGEHPELSADAAFSRVYCDPGEQGVMLRKALALAKETTWLDLQPTVISGGEWRDADDAEQAMRQLAEIGRRMAPSATPEKQFAVAFEDPKNAALAQRAHRRPQATTSFPFPR